MMTEAVHTPFMADRANAIENAEYIARSMAAFGDEITFKTDGIMAKRADDVLNKAEGLLETIEEKGMFTALSEGVFGGIKRPIDGGKGLKGVFKTSEHYLNPFMDEMKKQLKEGL